MAALPGLPRYCQGSAVNDLLCYVLMKAAAPSFWCCQLISPGVTRLAGTCPEPSSGVVWVLHSHRRHADMVAGALIPGGFTLSSQEVCRNSYVPPASHPLKY